jgi:hypothetical protein
LGILTSLKLRVKQQWNYPDCFINRPGSPFQPGRGGHFQELGYIKKQAEIN